MVSIVALVVTISCSVLLTGTLSKSYCVRAASFVTTTSSCISRVSASTCNRRGLPSSSTSSDNNSVESSPSLPPIAATKKRLFLVRHGEVINPGGDRPVYYGAMDVPLSNFGELEAKAAGTYLKRFDLQHIAASPLARAVFGANEIAAHRKNGGAATEPTRPKLFAGFRELDRGAWCGRTKSEIGAENMARFDACDESATPAGGESYPVLKKRVLAARDELLELTECGRASAVVSHLQVTRSMLSEALGLGTEEMGALVVATASVTCIDYDDVSGEQTVHFQSFKPDAGLGKSVDFVN